MRLLASLFCQCQDVCIFIGIFKVRSISCLNDMYTNIREHSVITQAKHVFKNSGLPPPSAQFANLGRYSGNSTNFMGNGQVSWEI